MPLGIALKKGSEIFERKAGSALLSLIVRTLPFTVTPERWVVLPATASA